MSDMKIGTTGQNYASADLTFQVNPKILNIPLQNNYTTSDIPFAKQHVFLGAGGVGIRRIILTGYVHGSSKVANFNNLAKQIHDHNVKRFWINSSYYFNVLGSSIAHTHQGGRTTFIDYVIAMDCVTPYALAASASTYSVTINDASKLPLDDDTAASSGAFTNAGSAPASVQWQIVNDAGSDITMVEIGDTNDYDTSPHKINWTGTLAFEEILLIEIFSYPIQGTRGTNKEMRMAYSTIDGTITSPQSQLFGAEMPWIDAGGTDQSFCIRLTGNDATATVTATWNASYIG